MYPLYDYYYVDKCFMVCNSSYHHFISQLPQRYQILICKYKSVSFRQIKLNYVNVRIIIKVQKVAFSPKYTLRIKELL